MSNKISERVYLGKDLEAMSHANNYSIWIIELFSSFLGNDIAEIGAGSGNLTKLLAKQNSVSTITAFEPSSEMYNCLAENIKDKNVITVNSTLQDASNDYKERFDSIFYINVLEHIQNDVEETRYIYNSLKKNGYICIFVPALSWLYSNFDASIGHFRRYHKKQLIELFASNGFEIVTTKYIDMIGIIPWYLNFVLMKRTLDQKTTKLYDNYAIPIIKKIENTIPSPIGKNLLLVGKKVN